MEPGSAGGVPRGVRDAIVVLATAALFVAPYLLYRGTPYRYLLADLGIGAIAVGRFRRGALGRLGLAIPPRELAAAAVLLGAGVLAARSLIDGIAASRGIQILEARPFFSLSQVLHQEIVLRALLLGGLRRWFPSRGVLALVGGLVFAGIHPLYVAWGGAGGLSLETFATLFAFGASINLLFLRAGHIAFSFAVHASWNLVRFGSRYAVGGVPVSELQTFSLMEGSAPALAASAALLVAVVMLERFRPGEAAPSSCGS